MRHAFVLCAMAMVVSAMAVSAQQYDPRPNDHMGLPFGSSVVVCDAVLGSDDGSAVVFKSSPDAADTARPGPQQTPGQAASATPMASDPARKESKWQKFSRGVAAAANVATYLYLLNYCPQVRRIPLMWMTADQYQLLQACMMYGF